MTSRDPFRPKTFYDSMISGGRFGMVVGGAQPGCGAPKALVGLRSHLTGTDPGGRYQYPFQNLLCTAPVTEQPLEQGWAATSGWATLYVSRQGSGLSRCACLTGSTKGDTKHHLPPPGIHFYQQTTESKKGRGAGKIK